LYFLPFDGSLGIDATGKISRQNYGVDYTGDEINLFEETSTGAFKTVNSDPTSNALFEINVIDHSKEANKEELFKRLNVAKADTSFTRGVVFKLKKINDKYQIDYSPGYAAPVLMEITRDDSKRIDFAEGFYALSSTRRQYTKSEYGDQRKLA